jgi:RNA polymerase sigma factor FliA
MQKPIATHLPRPNPTTEAGPALLEHLPMVRFQARQIHRRLPRNVDINDLFSAGLVGLMEALKKFDPAKNTRFGSYAQFRVRGAILDSLRALDWAPRHIRQRGRAAQEAIRKLSTRLGHVPTEDEVAGELKTSLDAYQQLRGDLDGLEIGSLYRTREDGSAGEELVYTPGRPQDDPLFRCVQKEIEMRLTEAIDELSERERLVLTLCYYEEMTRSEIALVLGLTETGVSQIRTSAVIHLRAALSDLAPQRPHLCIAAKRRVPRAAALSRPAA